MIFISILQKVLTDCLSKGNETKDIVSRLILPAYATKYGVSERNGHGMRKVIQTTTLFVSIFTIFIMSFITYLNQDIPDRFYVYGNQRFCIYQHQQVSAEEVENTKEVGVEANTSVTKAVDLKLLGVIPVKTTYLHQAKQRYAVPCGTPFGLKMLTAGVVVVGLTPIETETGSAYPAKNAGVEKGDVILSVDGHKVSSFAELSQRINETNGEKATFQLIRDGQEMSLSVVPVKSIADGAYKCGIWVRDSSAGIGTVTLYDPVTGDFGGLGHAVCDIDTGKPLPLSSGEVVPVTILDVAKGTAGTPGELRGTFLSHSVVGELYANNETGVYGKLKSKPVENEPIPVCLKQDVQPGPAQIYTTISGTKPKVYDIEIEKVNLNDHSPTKNMVLKITDPTLLEMTGGIVQGMSGSPIIQNGKLVGAVTHVFVNDPQRGYGIFAENMMENFDDLASDKAAGF